MAHGDIGGVGDGAEGYVSLLLVEQPQVVRIERDLLPVVPEPIVLRRLGKFYVRRAKPRRPGEALSPSMGPEALTYGSLALVPYQPEEQARRGKPLRKKRPVKEDKGLVMSREEDERLVREEKANLSTALALSWEEARLFGVVALCRRGVGPKRSPPFLPKGRERLLQARARRGYLRQRVSRAIRRVSGGGADSYASPSFGGDPRGALLLGGVPLQLAEGAPLHYSRVSLCRGPVRVEPHHGCGGVLKDRSCRERLGGGRNGKSAQRSEAPWERVEETITRLLADLDIVKLKWEPTKNTMVKLLTNLDAAKLE
ncbi:hypothetical protein ACLOJK_004000 [Asimina triloba]